MLIYDLLKFKDKVGSHTEVVGDSYFLLIFGYRPGDVLITASIGGKSDTLKILVRAPKLSVNKGSVPTKADPLSKGLVSDKNSETNATGVNCGRPISPLVGEGRNINVGGETEVPGSEDYTP